MKTSAARRLMGVIVGAALAAGSVLGLAAPALAAPATVNPLTLTTGYYASGSAYNPAGTKVAVSSMGDYAYIGPEVDIIDVATNQVTVVTDTNGYIIDPQGIVWSPDGSTIYTVNYSGDVVVIDADTAIATGTLSAGPPGTHVGLAISPDGETLFVSDYAGYSPVVVDIGTNNATQLSTPEAQYSVGMFVSPDGTKLYVVGYYGPVDIYDLTQPTPAYDDTIYFSDMGFGGSSVCSNFEGTVLYMADYNDTGDAYLSRLDLVTGDSVSHLADVDESIGCAVTPDGKGVLFGDTKKEYPATVIEVDEATMAPLTTYALAQGEATDVLASSPKTCDVYVSNFYGTTNILNWDCSALPDTGASQGLIITLATVGGGLVVLGAVAVFLVRRRQSRS